LGESIAAILTVVLPPQNFTASLMAGPAALFQLSGSPGVNYVLQATTNLASPSSWLPVFTNAAGANGSWSFTDTNVPLNPQMFYRALLP
jgi:hypothetical protein